MKTSIDYATIKGARSPEYNRRIATHEIGHCYISRAVGSFVDFVTIVPNGVFAGRCVRRGAPSPSLAFVDERAAEVEPIREQAAPTTDDIISICAKIGAPKLGQPRVAMADEITRAIVMVTELVAGRVCERNFYPDHDPLPAEHDYIEARALASVVCAAPSAVDAFIRFAEAEAEALIRAHLGVVTELVDALVEHGTLSGEQVDRIISNAVAGEMVADENARREQWRRCLKGAGTFNR
jgi:hypothetical protein